PSRVLSFYHHPVFLFLNFSFNARISSSASSFALFSASILAIISASLKNASSLIIFSIILSANLDGEPAKLYSSSIIALPASSSRGTYPVIEALAISINNDNLIYLGFSCFTNSLYKFFAEDIGLELASNNKT